MTTRGPRQKYRVSPCDDEHGRTWEILYGVNQCAEQLIPTRREARERCKQLNREEPTLGACDGCATETMIRSVDGRALCAKCEALRGGK